MELKNQVTSLEISQKLKALGVKQSSLWYWVNLGKDFDKNDLVYAGELANGDTNDETVSAFTVAELGELLPPMVKKEYNGVKEQIYKYIWENGSRDLWSVGYFTHDFKVRLQEFAPTEADARGKMLIYLLHHGLQDK